MENEILDLLGEALKKNFEENQKKPNQYVVAYYKQSDDSLIGYHASTFCQVTQDILDAKRYSGDNPYSQLETIAKNVKYTLKESHEGMFAEINSKIRDEDFKGMKCDEIYMDAVYLADGTPTQEFRMNIIK